MAYYPAGLPKEKPMTLRRKIGLSMFGVLGLTVFTLAVRQDPGPTLCFVGLAAFVIIAGYLAIEG